LLICNSPAQRGEPVSDVNRPPRRYCARGQRKTEHEVARPAGRLNERFEVNDLSYWIDHRRAGDAHRIDVAARQRRQRNGRAEARLPELGAGTGVERIDEVVLGGDNDAVSGRPIQRLGIDRAVDGGLETSVQFHVRRYRPTQRRRHVKPATVGGVVVGDNALGGDRVADAGGGGYQ